MRTLNTLRPDSDVSASRVEGRGLLTFANHTSLFDDPLVTSCLVDGDWQSVRWIAADALNFFGGPLRAAIFNAGKCVPIVRGAGVDQPGMHFLAERLDAGDWVHIFPEGGRSRDPEGRLQTPLKAGFAELVQAASPIVLAFHHVGMDRVLPIGSWVPRVGKAVTVRFGEPVDSRTELSSRSIAEITAWATEQLLTLERGVV
jgi:monolysocardiolipin acyltransferase